MSIQQTIFCTPDICGFLCLLSTTTSRFLLLGVRNESIHEYKNKPLGISFVLCLCSKIIAFAALLGPMTCLATNSWSKSGVKCGFHIVKLDLNQIMVYSCREQVRLNITF